MPGGLSCGYGIPLPFFMMAPALMLVGSAIRRKRRRS